MHQKIYKEKREVEKEIKQAKNEEEKSKNEKILAAIVGSKYPLLKNEKDFKQAKNEEEKSKNEKILAAIVGSKYPLLKNEKDLNQEQKDKLVELKAGSPHLKIMHELKEEFRIIFDKPQNWGEGLLALGSWLSKAQKYFLNSHLTIFRWLDEILAYFNHRTTSGVVEGINNKLKLIKRSAYGFTNFENFRNRCLLNWHFNY